VTAIPPSCRRGHPWPENLRWRPEPDGRRRCRACERIAESRRTGRRVAPRVRQRPRSIGVRVSPAEFSAIYAAAGGGSLSGWLRDLALEAARRGTRKQEAA
jgi:hypothetical protein